MPPLTAFCIVCFRPALSASAASQLLRGCRLGRGVQAHLVGGLGSGREEWLDEGRKAGRVCRYERRQCSGWNAQRSGAAPAGFAPR